MNNDWAAKLAYVYVNSRSMNKVCEHQRELKVSESKGAPLYALPKLLVDNTISKSLMCVYGSLGYDNLNSIGLDAFVASDHVHELHDVMEGRRVPGDEDDTVRKHYVLSILEGSPSSSTSHFAEQNEEGEVSSLG